MPYAAKNDITNRTQEISGGDAKHHKKSLVNKIPKTIHKIISYIVTDV